MLKYIILLYLLLITGCSTKQPISNSFLIKNLSIKENNFSLEKNIINNETPFILRNEHEILIGVFTYEFGKTYTIGSTIMRIIKNKKEFIKKRILECDSKSEFIKGDIQINKNNTVLTLKNKCLTYEGD